ncbi:MAG: bile acid:sodium symporter family protein [Chlamydiota bacterium]
MRYLARDWFTVCLLLTPLAAWAWPELGTTTGGLLPAETINTVGISIIFLLSGLCIRVKSFIKTLPRLKLHLYIQLFCFGIFPLVVVVMQRYVFGFIGFHPYIVKGIFILACLPTTISSCVVLTSLAGGDRASALFNGILSNLLGIFLSPVLVSIIFDIDNGEIALHPLGIIQKLIYMVLIPMVIGQTIYRIFKKYLEKHTQQLHRTSSIILIFIIYSVFCDTFLDLKALESPVREISWLIVVLLIYHLIFLMLSYYTSKPFNLKPRDRKALLFTAPQKTLAMGMPLIIAILRTGTFGPLAVELPMFALPLLLYHHIQLIVAGFIIPSIKS